MRKKKRNLSPETLERLSLLASERAAVNMAKDPDYYKKLGSKGGKYTGMKGFAVRRDLASKAGTIGGRVTLKDRKLKLEGTNYYTGDSIPLKRAK